MEHVKEEDEEAQMSAQWFADLDSFLPSFLAHSLGSRGRGAWLSGEEEEEEKEEEEESTESLFLPLLSLHSSSTRSSTSSSWCRDSSVLRPLVSGSRLFGAVRV